MDTLLFLKEVKKINIYYFWNPLLKKRRDDPAEAG
jgi:hypothetical protein